MRPTIPRESLLTERLRIDAALHAALTELAIPYGVSLSPRAFLDLSPARAVSRAGKPHDALSAQCPQCGVWRPPRFFRERRRSGATTARAASREPPRGAPRTLCARLRPLLALLAPRLPCTPAAYGRPRGDGSRLDPPFDHVIALSGFSLTRPPHSLPPPTLRPGRDFILSSIALPSSERRAALSPSGAACSTRLASTSSPPIRTPTPSGRARRSPSPPQDRSPSSSAASISSPPRTSAVRRRSESVQK